MCIINKKVIPSLRFPEFVNDGEWEIKTMGKIAMSFSGGTPSVNKKEYYGGNIPFIRSGEINSDHTELFLTPQGIDNSSAKIVKKGTILYALYGATSGEVGIARLDGAINQAILAIKPNEGYDSLFIYYYLKKRKDSIVHNYIQGGQGNLSSAIINALSIPIPTLLEQKRIASCLSAIDKVITTTNRKLEQLKALKKGLMQKLFPTQGKKLPELQFKDFVKDGEWREKKLGELFNRITRRNTENNQNILTISAQYGLVSQYDYFNKNVAALDVTNYYLINKGNFAYNKSRSQGYPYGAIKSLRLYDKGVVSTLYTCFKIKKEVDCNIDFFEQYFETDLINYEIGKIAQEGARNHGLLNISTDDFFNKVSIIVPSPLEQKKIADCLSSIDNMISLYTEKLFFWEQHKKGLMQKMFPDVK